MAPWAAARTWAVSLCMTNSTFGALLAKLVHRKADLTAHEYEVHGPESAAFLGDANIATSSIEGSSRHAVLIDLDVPAYLIPSSTPGHSHLYIDANIRADDLFRILEAMATAGIVEEGYTNASRARGYSALRLPWVKKEPAKVKPLPPQPRPVLRGLGF